MIIAALLGALTFGACVDSTESASVTAIRNAKAEQLKSIATLNNAKAQAEATIAAAEAQIAAAQAQLIAAQAAAVNAQTEAQKIANQQLAAQAADAIARLEAQMEIDLLKFQQQLLAEKINFMNSANGAVVALYTNYEAALANLATLKTNLAKNKVALAKAEAGIATFEETKAAAIEAAQAKLDSYKATKAGYEAEIAALRELSTRGMSVTEWEKCRDDYQKNYLAAVLKQATAAQAFTDAAEAETAIKALKPSTDYMEAYAEFMAMVTAGSVPAVAQSTSTDWDIDGDEEADFTNAPMTFVAGEDEVILFFPTETEARDFAGLTAEDEGYKAGYYYNHIVFDTDIVPEAADLYAEVALDAVAETYEATIELLTNELEAAEDLFTKATAKVSAESQVNNLIADYTTVAKKIAEMNAKKADAEAVLASYATVIAAMPELDIDAAKLKKNEYDGTYTYEYYSQIYDIAKKNSDIVAEAISWLTDFKAAPAAGEKDAVYTAQQKFANDLKAKRVVTNDGKEVASSFYSNNYFDPKEDVWELCGLVDFQDIIEDYIIENADGELVYDVANNNDVAADYFAAVTALENKLAEVADAIEDVDEAAGYLATMVEEYENWGAYLAEVNEAMAAKQEAEYNKNTYNAEYVAEVEATYNAVVNLLSYYAAFNAGTLTTPSDSADLEIAIAKKIDELKGKINDVQKGTKDGNDSIDEYTAYIKSLKASTVADQEALVASYEATIADLESDIAVAEANVARLKALLDEAMAL